MKKYGSYSDADLDYWQNLPTNEYVLTQSAFSAWLMRRDENKAKQFPTISLAKVKEAREKIDDLDRYFDNDLYTDNTDSMFKCDEVLEILDSLIAESEEE